MTWDEILAVAGQNCCTQLAYKAKTRKGVEEAERVVLRCKELIRQATELKVRSRVRLLLAHEHYALALAVIEKARKRATAAG